MLTGNMSVDMKEVSIERIPRQPGSSGSGGVCEDSESLDELSSDELEQNLQQQHELLTEIAALTRPNPYAQVSIPKTAHQWAKVKKYLWDHCDYSFNRLKEILPKALDSVQFPYKPFVGGNISYFAGWMHIGWDWGQLRLSYR